ncbi:hypothetical protein [Paraburkholderia humisilvae]|uniref:Uncharacterized protein n=1 Tax=Paraburkholderia humisilvae TaxID=627669 RepID=A0A6J5ECZ3_9BURK|nr:hypothetical protein [Paraburkholderia humisilvae]CAB3763176.1 hypothetical protein LMG29542_04520 [Paraburkholderia humisilvae]
MNSFNSAYVAGLIAGVLITAVSVAYAQNTPGVPGGVLPPDQFHLNEHPQLALGASEPSKKDENGKQSGGGHGRRQHGMGQMQTMP